MAALADCLFSPDSFECRCLHVSSGQSPADVWLTCDGYAGWAAEGVSTEVDVDGKELTCAHSMGS